MTETLFEKIMRKTFQTWRREKTCKFRKHRVPIKMKPKRPTPKNIIIKMPSFKDKERILKAAREKSEVTYKGALVRIAADLSTATLQARTERQKIFQVMKSKGLQPRLLYQA